MGSIAVPRDGQLRMFAVENQEQNQAYYDYQVDAENAPRIMEERIKLLRANELAPIHGRPVRVSAVHPRGG